MGEKRNDWDVTPGIAGGFADPYLRPYTDGVGIAGHEISRSEAEALRGIYSTGGEGMASKDEPAIDWAMAKAKELEAGDPPLSKRDLEWIAQALRWAKRNGKAEGLWDAARQAMKHGQMLLGAKGDAALPHFRELATSLNAQAAAEANDAPVVAGERLSVLPEKVEAHLAEMAARARGERVVMGSREREGAAYMPEPGDEIAPVMVGNVAMNTHTGARPAEMLARARGYDEEARTSSFGEHEEDCQPTDVHHRPAPWAPRPDAWPTVELRWVRHPDPAEFRNRLQQRWAVDRREGDELGRKPVRTYEWRDVPMENEDGNEVLRGEELVAMSDRAMAKASGR